MVAEPVPPEILVEGVGQGATTGHSGDRLLERLARLEIEPRPSVPAFPRAAWLGLTLFAIATTTGVALRRSGTWARIEAQGTHAESP